MKLLSYSVISIFGLFYWLLADLWTWLSYAETIYIVNMTGDASDWLSNAGGTPIKVADSTGSILLAYLLDPSVSYMKQISTDSRIDFHFRFPVGGNQSILVGARVGSARFAWPVSSRFFLVSRVFSIARIETYYLVHFISEIGSGNVINEYIASIVREANFLDNLSNYVVCQIFLPLWIIWPVFRW